MISFRRIFLKEDPFLPDGTVRDCPHGDYRAWNAKWLELSGQVCAFRKKFKLDAPAEITVHLSGDEEYEFFCDGQRIIQGPEHGDGAHWFFDTVELSLETGTHCFSARVWALGKWAPLRRISVHPGFFLAADSRFEPELSTGVADWETTPLKGIRFECGDYTDSSLNEWEIMRKATPWKPLLTTGVPHVFDLSEYPSDIASDALPWKCAVPGMNVFPGGKVWHYGFGPYLLPSELPSLELGTIGISGIDFPLTVCGGSKKEILLRLDNYYCFYPEIELSGTGELTLFYTEALVDSNGRKGNRNELAEKEFRFAKYDRFFAGENAFPVHPIYWRCGRFLKLVLKAGAGELTLHDLRLRETRYPWKFESEFHTESATVDKIGPALSRTVEMCSHDMFFDCPYHEALQYIGDTRIQALITNVLSRDRRLQRRAVRQFGWSFNFQGLPASHYPSRHRQCIPTFAPFWIGMVLDSCLYDADGPALAKELLPAVHAVVEYFENKRDGNGNVLAPRGWNYIEASLYPAEPERTDGTFELLWLYGLCLAERLESWIGSPAYQARLTAAIGPAKQAILRDYYRPEKHLFSQHKAKDVFNEVTQVLAVLSRRFPAECAEGLFEAKNILRCGYYFSHYYFEACGISDRMDCFLKRLREWEKVTENGMVTVPETDCGTTRSECHAWSSNPLFHYYSTIAGIRPSAPGFRKMEITPRLGSLPFIKGSMCHPDGFIHFFFSRDGMAEIQAPAGIPAVLNWNGEKIEFIGDFEKKHSHSRKKRNMENGA